MKSLLAVDCFIPSTVSCITNLWLSVFYFLTYLKYKHFVIIKEKISLSTNIYKHIYINVLFYIYIPMHHIKLARVLDTRLLRHWVLVQIFINLNYATLGKLLKLSVSFFIQLQNDDSIANSQRSCENK